jgi:hypothetical protein
VGGFWQKHWVTAATLLMVAFILFLAVAIALDVDDSSTAERTFGGAVLGICGLALLAGMWLLREGRATPVAYTLIVVVTLFVGVGFFWLLFIPTILAVVIIFFGVVRGGLVRELRPSPSAPPAAV